MKKTRNRTTLSLLTAGFVLAVWASSPTAARADNIDLELYKQAPKVMEYLQKQGYQNIGVLKFRVQKGAKPETFHAGPLNVNMASRLENMLILVNDAKQPIGIIHDASRVAADEQVQKDYTTDAGRKSLFDHRFPLAWGKDLVKVDAFLTGIVSISKDNRQAKVTIEAFDGKGAELKKVHDFSVRTDRTILADAGQNFLLTMRDFDKADQDEIASNSATYFVEEEKKATVAQSKDRYVDLQVLYNGRPVDRVPAASGEERIPTPKAGDTIQFKIKNIGKVKVGVLLGINGVNTLFEEVIAEKPPERCIKWILDPGEEYEINGFYMDKGDGGKTVKIFKVSEDSSKLAVYGDKLGLIQLSVFREGTAGATETRPEMKISFRGLSKRQLQKNPPKALPELQYRLANQMKSEKLPEEMVKDLETRQRKALREWQTSTLVKKGAIVPDEEKLVESGLTSVSFKNPQLIMQEVVRYYDPKSDN